MRAAGTEERSKTKILAGREGKRRRRNYRVYASGLPLSREKKTKDVKTLSAKGLTGEQKRRSATIRGMGPKVQKADRAVCVLGNDHRKPQSSG